MERKISIKNGNLYIDNDAVTRLYTERGDCYDNLTVTRAQIINGLLYVNGLKIVRVKTTKGTIVFEDGIFGVITQYHSGNGDNIHGDYIANANTTQYHSGNGDNIGGSKFTKK